MNRSITLIALIVILLGLATIGVAQGHAPIRVLFGFIAVLGLGSALMTVLAKNLIHAALYLVSFFFLVACQFVLLEAEFMAAIQVLIYIGAVAILLLFGIMLTRNIQGDETTSAHWGWKVPAGLAGLAVLAVLVFGIHAEVGPTVGRSWTEIQTRPPITGDAATSPRALAVNNMGRAVGDEMMTRFVIPFEVAGLLLTAALVGAVALAMGEGTEDAPRTGAIETFTGTTGNGDGDGQPVSRPEALSTHRA